MEEVYPGNLFNTVQHQSLSQGLVILGWPSVEEDELLHLGLPFKIK